MPIRRAFLLVAVGATATILSAPASVGAYSLFDADANPGPLVLAARSDIEVALPEASTAPTTAVVLGEALQVLRGRVLEVQDGLLRVRVGAVAMWIRRPLDSAAAPEVAVGATVEAAGVPTLGEIFEADTLTVLDQARF